MESWLDVLSKALAAGEVSRREALRRVSGAASGVLLAALGIGCAEDTAGPDAGGGIDAVRGRCKKVGQKCRQDAECCSSFCPPQTGKCSCPSDNSQICPRTGLCVDCPPPRVLNSACECICEEACQTCTEVGSCFTDFVRCGNCNLAACFATIEGPTFCAATNLGCENATPCASSAECPTGWACVVGSCCASGPEDFVCAPPCGATG